VEKRRQARLLSIFAIVLGLHLALVWLVLSSPRLLISTRSGSFEVVWIAPTRLAAAAIESVSNSPKEKPGAARKRVDASAAVRAQAPTSADEDNAIHPAPDWSEELKRAARDALDQRLAQKGHDYDFAHAFPIAPHTTPGIAWDYAATHRVEAIPGGGILIHLGDNCVLVLIPLPLVACGIGKPPADGDLFQHMHDQ
jgi:hypothetical protein